MRLHLKSVSFVLMQFSLGIAVFLLASSLLPNPHLQRLSLAQTSTAQTLKVEADQLFKQGEQQFAASNLQAASQLFQQALVIYQQIGERAEQGQALKSLGNVAYALQDYEKAIEYQQQALAIAREIDNWDLEVRTLNNLGLIYRALKNSPKEIEYLEQALAALDANENQELRLLVLTNLSLTYDAVPNQPIKVIEYARPALQLARSLKQQPSEASILILLSNAYLRLKEPQEAMIFAQQALEIAQTIDNRDLEALSLIFLSESYLQLDNYAKTIELAETALTLSDSLIPQVRQRALITLATAYRQTNQEENAITALQQVLETVEINGRKPTSEEARKQAELIMSIVRLAAANKPETTDVTTSPATPTLAQPTAPQIFPTDTTSLLQAAQSSLRRGESHSAVELAMSALASARTGKQREMEGQAILILAQAYVELGRDQNAIAYALQAREIGRELNNQELQGYALVWQAIAASSAEEQSAIELAKQAIEMGRKTKKRDLEAWGTFALANIFEQQQAVDWAKKTIDIAREIQNLELEAWGYTAMSSGYFQIGAYQEALTAAQSALKIAQTIQHRTLEGYAISFYTFAVAGSGNHQAVAEVAPQAISIAKELHNQQIEAFSLTGLALSQIKTGEYREALKTVERAVKVSRELQKAQLEAAALTLQINIHTALQSPQQALAPAQRLVTLAQEQNDREEQAKSLALLANVHLQLKDYEKVLDSAQQVITVAQELQQPATEASGLLMLAVAYVELQNYQPAIAPLQRLLTIVRQQGQANQSNEVVGLSLLARAYAGVGNLEMAKASAQEGEAIAQSMSELNSKVSALIQVRYAYEVIDQGNKIDQLSEQILALARQQGDPDLMWQVIDALSGSRLRQSGDFRDLTELFDEYVMLAQQKGEVDGAKLAQVMGLYFLSEDTERVSAIADYILKASPEQSNNNQKLAALIFLSLSSWQARDYTQLKEIASIELPKLSASDKASDQAAYSLVSFIIFAATEDYDRSIQAAEKFIELIPQLVDEKSPQPVIAVLTDFFRILSAPVYAKAGRSPEAIAILQDGIEKLDKWSPLVNAFSANGEKPLNALKATLLTYLAEIYRQSGETSKAIALYREALSLPIPASVDSNINSADAIDYRSISYAGLGRIYQQQNLSLAATTYYKQAINQIEKKRQGFSAKFLKLVPGQPTDLAALNLQNFSQNWMLKGYLGDLTGQRNSDIYRQLADLLLTQGRIAEAQQVLERLKIQELNDFTRGTRSSDQVSEVDLNTIEAQILDKHGSLIDFGRKLVECEAGLEAPSCSQLADLQSQYSALTQKFDQEVRSIESQVAGRRSEQIATGTQDFIASADKIVSAQANTVLIYPLVLPDKVHLLWASKGGVLNTQVCEMGETELWQTISEFRQLLKTPNSEIEQVKATGKKLYDCLVKPLEPELQKNKIQKLVFVPDRATNYIPMAALFDGEKFLVERYVISSVLNAGLTDVSDRLPPSPQQTEALALGLSEAKEGFNALPNVPLELDALVRQNSNDSKGVYPGAEFLNESFTLEALQNNLSDRKILHIATHGAFVPEDPKKSYLLLGNGEKYPIYQIQFLRNLRDVHLVVLSACETALGGPDANGTEIPGISSYFLRDKAKAVIASLWLVNDASTSLLMQKFYQKLANDQITKAEALREVQLELLQANLTQPKAAMRADLADSSRQISAPSPVNFAHPYYWAPFILIGNSL